MDKKVLVVGDVIADVFIYGTADRISPEAPVPVVSVTDSVTSPGGAANVALNAAAQGVGVVLVGCRGAADEYEAEDETADGITATLEKAGVTVRLVEAGCAIPVKTRVMAGGRQLLRYDYERKPSSTPEDQQRVADTVGDAVAAVMPEVGVMVLSDYAKGTLNVRCVAKLRKLAFQHNVPVVVDPKGDWEKYAGVTVLTPNWKELTAYCEVAIDGTFDQPEGDDGSAKMMTRFVSNHLDIENVVVTMGAHGAHWFAADTHTHIKGRVRHVCDPTGAGDVFVGVLAAGMLRTLTMKKALARANFAAGMSVTRPGIVVVDGPSLDRAYGVSRHGADKLVSQYEAVELAAAVRRFGGRVGFANGCFDLLHPGHVAVLTRAADACDLVVVGVNSDDSVRQLKGAGRPVQNLACRVGVLAALETTDLVVAFDGPTPEALIEALQVDVLVKGAEYENTVVPGADGVKARGGEVLFVPTVEGHSTTRTVEEHLT